MKKKSLEKNYVYNFISLILTLIIPLITTPYLARVFHESGNGQIAFANNIVSYFTMFANLGYLIYGQKEIAKYQDNDYMRSKTFWEIIIIRGVLTIISFIVLIVTVNLNIYGASYNFLIMMFAIQIIAVAFDITFYYQGLEDFRAIAVRTILIRGSCLVLVFLLVKNEADIWIYAVIYSVSFLLANLLMWPKLCKSVFKVKMTDLEFKKHFLPSIIIFLPTLATTVYASLNKLMIGYLAVNPDYENGCYSQALKLNQTIRMLITVIDSVMMVRNFSDFAAKKYDSVKNHLYLACSYVIHLGIPLIFGICVLSSSLSAWFLGDGYVEVPMLLNIMSVRFVFSGLTCVFGNQLFIVIGKEKYTTWAHVVTTVTNLLLNFIFIPKFGAIGAAITFAIAEIVDCLILAVIVFKDKYLSLKKVLKMFIKPVIAAGVMLVAIIPLNGYFAYNIFTFALIAAVGAGIYGVVLLVMKDDFANLILVRYVKPMFHKFLSRYKR